MDGFVGRQCRKQTMQPGVYLLLIRQIQRLQLGALVSGVDLQQVVEVGGEDQRATLHQLQHRAQQVLAGVLHLALQVVKHLVEAVLEECGAHVACALKERQRDKKIFSAEQHFYFYFFKNPFQCFLNKTYTCLYKICRSMICQ